MLLALKYFLWLLTNAIALAGSWFFEFTETNKKTGRKNLIRWGRIALPAAIVSLTLALAVTLLSDIWEARERQLAREAAERDKAEMESRLDSLSESNTQIIQLVSLMSQPFSPDRDRRLAALTQQPDIQALADKNPRLAQVLVEIESRLGGKDAVLNRLNKLDNSALPDENYLIIIASFNLQLFGRRKFDEVHQWVIRTIRGMEADIIALQELQGEEPFRVLLRDLPEFEGIISRSGPADQRQAILYRRNRVKAAGNAYEIDGNFARRPLVQRFRIEEVSVDIVNVHLKSRYSRSADRESIQQRTREVTQLADWVEAQGKESSVILIGQLQTELDGPELMSLREIGVRFATADLPEDAATFIPRNFGILKYSHIGMKGDVQLRYIPGSSHVYELTELIPELSEREIRDLISDHNPVSVVFRSD